MNPAGKPSVKRRRGVTLSASGLQRLHQAVHQIEHEENGGRRYSAEDLSDRVGISTSTLSRLWSAKAGVDRRTLTILFSAFKLDLQESDLQQMADHIEEWLQPQAAAAPLDQIPYPSSPVPLHSSHYIDRSEVDDRACQEIQQPGSVIRIKAPSGFGKTSLLLRLLHKANQLGYATASIDLRQADTSTLAEPRTFLFWLCTVLARKLAIDASLDQYWDDSLGSNLSATLFLREAILPQLRCPLVLVISDVERVFEYLQTAKNLLPLLRSWHEEAQHDEIWKQLRLVVSYSTDAYLPLDINQSPFNVGLPLTLPEFNREQVQRLSQLYAIRLDETDCDRLLSFIGGNPSLVTLALYHLQREMPLDQLLRSAGSLEGIYRNHLQRLLAQVSANPQWLNWLAPLVADEESGSGKIVLDPIFAYKLEGIGLIQSAPSGWQLRCKLYQVFFQTFLPS